MANIGDVLRHLVNSSDTISLGNRQEMLDAIDAEYPLPAPSAEVAIPAPAEVALTAEEQRQVDYDKDAQIAALEAEIARLGGS